MSDDDQDEENEQEDQDENSEQLNEAIGDENDDDDVTHDKSDPDANTPDVNLEEADIRKTVLDCLLNSSDSESEGDINEDNRGLDTSISSRNSGGSKRSNNSFYYPETQFTATEESILSPILNKTYQDVPISRPFVSSKSCSSNDIPSADPKTKTSSKSVTRSSQLTIPLSKASQITQSLVTDGNKLLKGQKRVLAVNTEEAGEYSWDKDKRKRTRRT